MKMCPINDLECPYIDKLCRCTLEAPEAECDEYQYYNNIDIEKEDDCDYEIGYDPYLGCFSNDC